MIDVEITGFVDALADERLLEPGQFEEFSEAMLPLCQDPLILARELAWRGWLSPFQIETILAGEVDSLFLGSYVLQAPLGQGGMARVFRARNWKLGRTVAIKLIVDDAARHPATLARFQREIHALGKIRHPNIVQAIDAELKPGTIFYAMEYFEGCDLGQYVATNGPLPVSIACDFIRQTADALQHAHEHGFIHRDIKPSNLLLTRPDNIIKMLDLGLTRSEVPVNDSVFNELTRAGALIGTPDYMSPEQVKDSRGTDIRSDLYSLGCTFYYLLAGMAPFQHLEAIVDKLYAQRDLEPTPIGELRPDLPPEVAAIVGTLMAKRRRDRFQSPAELSQSLNSLALDAQYGFDTVIDARAMTIVDTPSFQRNASDRTLALSHSEIEMVERPESSAEMDFDSRSWLRYVNPSMIVVLALIAVLAVLMIMRTQNQLRPLAAPLAPAPIVQPAPESAVTLPIDIPAEGD